MRNLIIETRVKIPESRIFDLLVCACEGGTGYWACLERLPYDAKAETLALPIKVYDQEDDDKEHTLDDAALFNGFKLMAEKFHDHFANFLGEREDAETGDVFLQCALLGDVIYG